MGYRKNILLLKMGVPKISVSGHNRIKDCAGVGLPKNLERRFAVDCRIAHGKEESRKLQIGIKVFLDLINGS